MHAAQGLEGRRLRLGVDEIAPGPSRAQALFQGGQALRALRVPGAAVVCAAGRVGEQADPSHSSRRRKTVRR